MTGTHRPPDPIPRPRTGPEAAPIASPVAASIATRAWLVVAGVAFLVATTAAANATTNAATNATAGVGWVEGTLFSGVGLFAVALVVLLLLQTSRRNAIDDQRRAAVAELEETRDALEALRAKFTEADHRATMFESVLGMVPFPIWHRDGGGEIDIHNQPVASLLAGRPPTATLADRALRLGVTQSESRHIVVDGERRLYEFTETPIDGRPGTAGWALDVTTLEEIQSDLSRHLDAHEVVLEQLSTAIAVFGPDRRLRFHNTAYRRLWELAPTDLAGAPSLIEILELLRERRRLPEQVDFGAFREQWTRLFSSLVEPREELMFLPDDTTLKMGVMPHPLGGLLLTFEDVTDRLALERSYNTLNAVQRETIDNLKDGVAVFGADGRMRVSNTEFARLWSIDADVLDGEPHLSELLDLMRPLFDPAADWTERRRDILSQVGRRDGASSRIDRSDGSVLDCTYVPLPDGATLFNYRDISDAEAVQRALQERNEALETADRLKSEFIASVSYELRTPLNAIIGFSELLGEGYVGPLNERQQSYAKAIQESSAQLVTLINDILDLATIEAGYLQIEPTVVDVHELIESVVGLARERARARLILIESLVPAEIGTIEADRLRLRQAIFNLLSNAIMFTAEGGRVAIEAARIPDAIEITVSDTGSGLVRLSGDDMNSASGGARARTSGLGLTLVRRLIDLHHGELTIRTEDNDDAEDLGAGVPAFSVSCRLPERQPLSAPGAGEKEIAARETR